MVIYRQLRKREKNMTRELRFEVEDSNGDYDTYEMDIEITEKLIKKYYGEIVEEEIWDEDEDFMEYIKEVYQDEAQNEYNETIEYTNEMESLSSSSRYW